MKTNQRASKFRYSEPRLLSGEGRFHELLKLQGMSEGEFAKLVGMSVSTVKRWYGFPLHGWPIALLEERAWRMNLCRMLEDRGIDPGRFKPGHLPRPTAGHYPRTTAQGEAIVKALVAAYEGKS